MKIKLFLLIPIIFLMTGCWDYNELNTMAIVTGLAVDKDVNNKLQVSLLISNSKKNEAPTTDEASTIIYTGAGDTMAEALKEIALVSPKKLYLGHLSVAIISEDIADTGLSTISDYLLREPESIKSFYLVLAKDSKAKDILSILSPLESFPSQSIYKNIRVSSDSQAISLAVPYSNFVENMITTGKNGILPSIVIEHTDNDNTNKNNKTNSTPAERLKIDTIGIFKNDKLVGYVSEKASKGISILENSVNQMSSTIKCGTGKVVANISSLKTKKFVKKNTIDINIKGSSYLKDVSCNIDLNDIENINKLENSIEEDIKNMVERGIKESQNYNSDIFGFGNLIYKTNPKYFNSIKNKWNKDIYPNLNPNINVNIKLISNGSTSKTIKEAINEK